jgi:uncharacterized protein YbaA (DUF1428 family)
MSIAQCGAVSLTRATRSLARSYRLQGARMAHTARAATPLATVSARMPEKQMTYVDGFVAAVPTANREIYKKHAEAAAVVFKEHGALKLVECWGDDVPEGKVTSFPMAVKRKDDETVVFSWIVWPSRKVRDQGMEKVMADARLKPDVNPMPFDGKRLIYGGFEMIVDA